MHCYRKLPRAGKNTNSACEAWHLILKRCIDRWFGEMQGRRMDALVDLLLKNAIFMYSMHLKRKELVANLKAENVAISNHHLAEHELKNAKVYTVLLTKFSFL
jgi:hypothetical protein